MQFIIKMMRLMTHINIGATLALMAWLAMFNFSNDTAPTVINTVVERGGAR